MFVVIVVGVPIESRHRALIQGAQRTLGCGQGKILPLIFLGLIEVVQVAVFGEPHPRCRVLALPNAHDLRAYRFLAVRMEGEHRDLLHQLVVAQYRANEVVHDHGLVADHQFNVPQPFLLHALGNGIEDFWHFVRIHTRSFRRIAIRFIDGAEVFEINAGLGPRVHQHRDDFFRKFVIHGRIQMGRFRQRSLVAHVMSRWRGFVVEHPVRRRAAQR